MALIEPNRIVASSLDNFLIVANNHYIKRPFVDFKFHSSGFETDIVFSDATDADNYSLTINGKSGNPISYQTFNTNGSVYQCVLNFIECLKLNNIVYNVSLMSMDTVRAYLDTSINYSITSSNNAVTIIDAFSTYKVGSFNKIVLNLSTDIGEFNLEKYVADTQIPFKITSIFDSLNIFSPCKVNMMCYSVYENNVELITLNNSQITVMPTTLTKFEEVNYDDYYIEQSISEVKKFLTDRKNPKYNYGEVYAISVLTDYPVESIDLVKKYYTNSGMFLTQEKGELYKEANGRRIDLYDRFDLDNVEKTYNHQVGYVEIVAVNASGTELTESLRFDINPKCNDNYTIYFLNKIGGVDSYNFTSTYSKDMSVKGNNTYYRNNLRSWDREYAIENVKKKQIKTTHTYTTSHINNEECEYLNELQRSKYCYVINEETFVKYIIIVDKFDIEYTSDDKQNELTVEFYVSDENKNY